MEEKTTEMLLEEQLQTGIKHIGELQDGSEEKARQIDDVATLYKLKIEEAKAHAAIVQAENDRVKNENDRIKNERESEHNAAVLKHEKILQYVKTGAEVGIFLIGLAFYGKEITRGYKYEENGYVASKTFMGVINNCFGRFRFSK